MQRTMKSLGILLLVFTLSGCGLIPKISFPVPTREQPALEQPPSADVPEVEQTTMATEMFLQTEPEETEQETVETQPVVTTSPVMDQEAKIQQIRAWYQNIVLDANLERRTYGDAADVYLQKGTIVSITEYHQLNDDFEPAMETVHYYYHNGVPFFVFIEYDHCEYEEVRLYFDNGQLIRWKIDGNDPKDNIPNAEWQSYYEIARAALQNAPRE